MKLATNLQQDKDIMEKIIHLRRHCDSMNNLVSFNPLLPWGKFTLNLSYLRDKIILGEF